MSSLLIILILISLTSQEIKILTIEDLNDQLKNININLSDLQLSCLCSKFSIESDLRKLNYEMIKEEIINEEEDEQ